MGAKKIIIPIAIAVVVACGAGYYCYNTVKATSSSSVTTSSSSLSSTEVSSENASTTNVSASEHTKAISKSNEDASNDVINSNTSSKATSSNSTKTTQSVDVDTSSNATSSSSSTSKTSNTNGIISNSGTITYSVPSDSYSPSTVLVKNTTGNPISEAKLNEYLRSWIMVGQENCQGICDATGTLWSEPWLNKVSQNTMYQAFVDANGEAALSQNITANEFIKATQELDTLTENDVPFTFSQAKNLILEMLQEDGYATPSEVTKITFVQGTPSVYEVYTKESGNYVFWTVYANNGYAHG